MGDEGFFDRVTAGDEFLVLAEQAGRWRAGRWPRPRCAGRAGSGERATVHVPAGTSAVIRAWPRSEWARCSRPTVLGRRLVRNGGRICGVGYCVGRMRVGNTRCEFLSGVSHLFRGVAVAAVIRARATERSAARSRFFTKVRTRPWSGAEARTRRGTAAVAETRPWSGARALAGAVSRSGEAALALVLETRRV
jgi:hypothetical protein